MASSQHIIEQLLAPADIKINGDRPWDIKVKDDRFFNRVIHDGTLGVGESYMDGQWECDAIDEMVSRAVRSRIADKVMADPKFAGKALFARLTNSNPKSKAFEVGEQHYDLGNDLFEAMLDKRMVYTCAYWKNAKNLDQAQENKLDLVCKKIGLEKGMTVLDIGGGWGSFAKYAAETYGAHVVNITVSKEQVALGNERCKGLPVDNVLMDYRDATAAALLGPSKKFDRIVSLGMFEHVGHQNYREYMQVAQRCLREDGLFLLHTIGTNQSTSGVDKWLTKYIFPNSALPSIKRVGEAAEKLFVVEDWHNFGAYYDLTLMAWHENFEKHWPELKDAYGDRFYRMWRFYLLVCAGLFRARSLQLWQIVLSPYGVPGGYESIR